MKFYTIFLSLLFVSSANIHAQNGDIVKEARYVSINYAENIDTFRLLFNTHRSFFIKLQSKSNEEESKSNEEEMAIESNEDGGVTINMRLAPEEKAGEEYVVYTDLKSNKIISRQSIFTKDNTFVSYMVHETINRPQWVILNETKKIDNFNCTKAVTEFRGRHYTAWFTEEIPTVFGPWKLNGLPGLIVQVNDATNSIQYHLINYKNYSNVDKIDEPKGEKNITLREYAELRKLQVENMAKLIQSKLPRGAIFEVESIEDDPLELTYEWEKH